MKRQLAALTCLVVSAIALPALATPTYRIDGICQLGTPTDINNQGQAIGYTGFDARSGTSFLWQKGQLQTLPTPGGGAIAAAINEKGQITGYSTRPGSSEEVAVMWQDGVITPINNTPVANNRGMDINENGSWWAIRAVLLITGGIPGPRLLSKPLVFRESCSRNQLTPTP